MTIIVLIAKLKGATIVRISLIHLFSTDSMNSYVKGGTVDALIAEATVYRDAEFVQTIIFTHSTFTTTDDILKKCMQR